MDGPTALGTGILDGSGIANLRNVEAGVGQNSMDGDIRRRCNNAGSTSAVLTQIVNATDFTLFPQPKQRNGQAGNRGRSH